MAMIIKAARWMLAPARIAERRARHEHEARQAMREWLML